MSKCENSQDIIESNWEFPVRIKHLCVSLYVRDKTLFAAGFCVREL